MPGPVRQLAFASVAEARAELAKLASGGYQAHGKWNLAQICDHLAFFIEGSLDGHRFTTPWLLKFLFGRMALRAILSTGRMKPGIFTPQKPLPEPTLDPSTAVLRLDQALARLEQHSGAFHDSPFFGHLAPQEWRQLHLTHCAHHFGYLTPKAPTDRATA